MALFLPKSQCALCNEILEDSEKVILFPPITGNKNDPLWVISDGCVHKECYDKFSHKRNMEIALGLYEKLLRRGNRCVVCNKSITNPDDVVSTGYLTSDNRHPLFKYNYYFFHKQCVKLIDAQELLRLLIEFKNNSDWNGEGLSRLISSIKNSL